MSAALEPTTCPRCNGSGWLPASTDSDPNRVQACGCQGDLRRRQRFAGAKIPKRYEHCTLANFYDNGIPALSNAKRLVQEFIDVWPGGRRGLLLQGSSGSGKTHLAVAALREIVNVDKPGRVLFENFQDLILEIQASFESDVVPSKSQLLRPLLEADLLVLDELGSQSPRDFVKDILYYLINTRYNEERATIFTTTFLDTGVEAKEYSLAHRIGAMVRSRLYEMADEIKLVGVPDYRARRKNMI